MKIFFDTEFIDYVSGAHLLSLGAVREDGVTFYAENSEAPLHLASTWVKENVLAKFTGPSLPLSTIADDFRVFCGSDDVPEFWAYYGTYDWLLVMQLYSGFFGLPVRWPRYFNEIATAALLLNKPRESWPQMGDQNNIHNALQDAKWDKLVYEHIVRQEN